MGAAGLGVSLYEIHIYVSPLKRFIQVRIRNIGPHSLSHDGQCSMTATKLMIMVIMSHLQGLWAVGALSALVLAVTQVGSHVFCD